MSLWHAAREYYHSKFRRFSSRDALLHWQHGKLKKHLAWVCENSPYYKDYHQLPLSEFPLMDKASMMDNFNQINTLGLDRDELFDIALRAENSREFTGSIKSDITVGLSSGTSGRRGLFLVSKEEQACWAGYIVGRLLPSILKPQRISLLLRANSNLYGSVGRAHISFQYTDLCQPVENWLSSLEEFNPTIMVGSAQALLVAARQGKGLTPELIVSGAEVLTPQDKRELSERFNCEVKEVYQCTEGFLASTHHDGQMRWNEDLVHIEKHWINKERSHFQPVVTDFRRKTQPVIRYLMDDLILPSHDGGVFDGIDQIVGRSGDMLTIAGVQVLPDLIYNAVSRSVGAQINYQVTQISANRLRINSNHSGHIIEESLRKLISSLGVGDEVNLSFEHAADLLQDLSIKHRRVVNLCDTDCTGIIDSAA